MNNKRVPVKVILNKDFDSLIIMTREKDLIIEKLSKDNHKLKEIIKRLNKCLENCRIMDSKSITH